MHYAVNTTTHMNFDDELMMNKWKKKMLPASKSDWKLDSNGPKGCT